MSRVKIVMILSGFPRRSETFALNEVLALEADGMLAAIFATKDGDGTTPQPGSEQLLKQVQILKTGSPTEQAEMVIELLDGRDITGVHGYFAHTPAEVAAMVAKRLGVPYSFSTHAFDARKVPAATLAERARNAACVIACNPDVAGELKQSGATIHLIPHGVDTKRFYPRPLPPAKPVQLLAVGRLMEKKGFDILISACEQLSFPFHLRILGEGPERVRLETAIVAAGLRSNIELGGGITHTELPLAYSSSHILVVPSILDKRGDRDGLPNVVLEAMASGRPVVASDIGAIGSAVYDDLTGILVPPGDTTALARALDLLANNPTLCSKLGQNGRECVEWDFNLGECANRLVNLLKKVYR